MATRKVTDMTAQELVRQVKSSSPGLKAAKTRETNKRISASDVKAASDTEARPYRYENAQSPGFFQPHPNAPEGDTAHLANTKMSMRQIYRAQGWGSDAEATTTQGHPTLPGVHEAVERQYMYPAAEKEPRMSDYDENHPVIKAARVMGVTPASAVTNAGAHLDQAFRSDPNHKSFYATRGQDEAGLDRPKERIVRSASEVGVPPAVHAMANAITSPRTKFTEVTRAGKVQYTNDDNARVASEVGKRGNPEEIATAKNMPGRSGFHGNTQRAAKAVDFVMNQGKTIQEAWGSSSPKTGPFHNAWVDESGPRQRWVADTHSGTPSVAPHLRTDAEKIAFMTIPGVHDFIHAANREAMSERGLSSVTGTQSAHWNEQRRQSADEGNRSLVTQVVQGEGSARREYKGRKGTNAAIVDGMQGRLF